MKNKFTAVYYINKYLECDDSFGYELLELQCLFEEEQEENSIIGEYSSVYETIISLLLDKDEGFYRVFICGSIEYTEDYFGEHDVNICSTIKN